MRRFLILAHKVPPGGAFTLNDLAGGGGRVDEVARAVSTAFTLSNDLRTDTEVTILFVQPGLPGPRRIRLTGARLRFLNPDERSTGALLKNALVRVVGTGAEVESSPGLVVGPCDPLPELRAFLALPGACWLTEEGTPIDGWRPSGPEVAAVLSDPFDPDEAERGVLTESGVPRIRLGPRSMRTSQCIDVFHNHLDRVGFDVPPAGDGTD